MSSYPEGTFPVVFESGVLRFDEDGALHVHLSHSAGAPHPLQTHPDGEDTHVDAGVSAASVAGSRDDGAVQVLGMPEADALPEGLVLTFTGWSTLRRETSGDLSILLEGVVDPPE